jgi:catechol 2,3-dioxygenase-like lactoylglutathione lyase family enzyme
MISRRLFLALTGSAALVPRLAWTADQAPTLLDHILLGCNDLDQGIAFFEQRLGVRAAYGGVHPGRGTRNALLSLGERQYIEIIAPDPRQENIEPFAAKQWNLLKKLATPSVIAWAAHIANMETFAKKLGESGVAFVGPWPGSRARPDGKVLNWKTLSLTDDRQGSLPFFIEWSAGSVHPSVDAPAGCRLERFAVAGPDPMELSKTLQRLGIQVPVERDAKPHLHAVIGGPGGSWK